MQVKAANYNNTKPKGLTEDEVEELRQGEPI